MTNDRPATIRLRNWTARRSGARMTITARRVDTGAEVKVSVDFICGSADLVIPFAEDRKTRQHYVLTLE